MCLTINSIYSYFVAEPTAYDVFGDRQIFLVASLFCQNAAVQSLQDLTNATSFCFDLVPSVLVYKMYFCHLKFCVYFSFFLNWNSMRGQLNRLYSGQPQDRLVVPLPEGVTACDIGTLTVWDQPFFATFARISIPRSLTEVRMYMLCLFWYTTLVGMALPLISIMLLSNMPHFCSIWLCKCAALLWRFRQLNCL